MTKQTPVDYSILPPHMQHGAEMYVERGIPPGGFLLAILQNDFMAAAGRADMINLHQLHIWALWLYNNVPSACHGSEFRVSEWIKSGGLEGREKAHEEDLKKRRIIVATCEHDIDDDDNCRKCGENFTDHLQAKGSGR